MSVQISTSDIKLLRQRTGAGPMACKQALEQANGDLDQAQQALRIKLGKKAGELASRDTSEGRVGSYIHATGKVGALVQVECNTDFVASNQVFKDFVDDLALHIAGTPSVVYVSADQIPTQLEAVETETLRQQLPEGKPQAIQDKILEGKLRVWRQELVLLEQVHINADKHQGKTIEQLRSETSTRTGENIVIRQFSRFQIS